MAADRVIDEERRHEGHRRIEHRDVDELALAGVRALEQRARDAECQVMPPIASQTAKPARVGPRSLLPVIDIRPLIAWILPS